MVLLLLLLILMCVPLVLWFGGFLGSGPDRTPVAIQPVTTVDITALTVKAEACFENGDFGMAHKYYARMSNSGTDTSLFRKRYLETKYKLITQLTGTIRMQPVEGGSFHMGREGTSGDNSPAHKVNLAPFEISSHEVTMEQYLLFLNAFDCSNEGYVGGDRVLMTDHPGLSGAEAPVQYTGDHFSLTTPDKIPAFGVTWLGAKMFCKFIGARLPTEAEWEFAARSGTGMGEGLSPERMAWFSENASAPMAVGTKTPNGLGIYDMNGNVWEWCEDYYDKEYYKVSPEDNPTGPARGKSRVIRGGDVKCGEQLISSTYRSFMYESLTANDYIGFRICK